MIVDVKGYCPVNVEEVYRSEGLHTHRYLYGDFLVKIRDQGKTIYISDFAGTQSQTIPGNCTMLLEENEIKYYKENLDYSFIHYQEQHKNKTYRRFFDAIDRAVKKRHTEHCTLTLSSGHDSGVIAASLLEQDLPFESLSVTGIEDLGILQKRSNLIDDFRIITDFNASDEGHAVAARNCKTNIILSGLGADEFFVSQDYQLMRKFIEDSEKIYKSFGIEVRYPLLDPEVFVEYHMLHKSLRRKKLPFEAYMEYQDFPYSVGAKRPFSLYPCEYR